METLEYFGKCPNCDSEKFNLKNRTCPDCGYRLEHNNVSFNKRFPSQKVCKELSRKSIKRNIKNIYTKSSISYILENVLPLLCFILGKCFIYLIIKKDNKTLYKL